MVFARKAQSAANPLWSRRAMSTRTGAAVSHAPTVSSPGDPLEREADAVSDRVMRMAQPGPIGSAPQGILRKCAECKDEETTPIQRAPAPSARVEATADAGAAVRATERGGAPLSPAERAFFEPRFGHDFSRVRVHADGEAAMAARAVQARAYTFGHDIVFNRGEYVPHTSAGRRLLAHELAHVVQQGGAPATIQRVENDNATTPAQDQGPAGGSETGFWDCLKWKLMNEQERTQHCKARSAEFCEPTCTQFPEGSAKRLECTNCCWCHVLDCLDSSCGEFPNIFADTGCKHSDPHCGKHD